MRQPRIGCLPPETSFPSPNRLGNNTSGGAERDVPGAIEMAAIRRYHVVGLRPK